MLKSWAAFHTRPLLFANVSTGALPASMGKDLRTWAGAFNGTISEVRRCFVTGLLALIFMVQLVSRFYVHHFTIDSKRLFKVDEFVSNKPDSPGGYLSHFIPYN